MKQFLRAIFAACALAISAASAAAVPLPTASDFVITETPGNPGFYTVTNNAEAGYWIISFEITHDTDANSPFMDATGPLDAGLWSATDLGNSFKYTATSPLAQSGNSLGSGETSSQFAFYSLLVTSDWTIELLTPDNETTFVSGSVNAVPLPAALPLFATGLGMMGLLGWRRKKKAAALTAS